mmetsp:Transcript_17538/g.40472  ORF Transcript_17538/g.40472 Transcript_17538/m.40472 type:complete len:211 (-) Transcript_17538:1088-1720(-)
MILTVKTSSTYSAELLPLLDTSSRYPSTWQIRSATLSHTSAGLFCTPKKRYTPPIPMSLEVSASYPRYPVTSRGDCHPSLPISLSSHSLFSILSSASLSPRRYASGIAPDTSAPPEENRLSVAFAPRRAAMVGSTFILASARDPSDCPFMPDSSSSSSRVSVRVKVSVLPMYSVCAMTTLCRAKRWSGNVTWANASQKRASFSMPMTFER